MLSNFDPALPGWGTVIATAVLAIARGIRDERERMKQQSNGGTPQAKTASALKEIADSSKRKEEHERQTLEALRALRDDNQKQTQTLEDAIRDMRRDVLNAVDRRQAP